MDREIHFHFQIGADATLILPEVKAATAAILRMEMRMAELDDKLNGIATKIAELKNRVASETQQVLDKVTRFQSTVDDLTAQRDALQKIIDAGVGLTPEQQAKFDAINAALDSTADDVDKIDLTTPSVVLPTG